MMLQVDWAQVRDPTGTQGTISFQPPLMVISTQHSGHQSGSPLTFKTFFESLETAWDLDSEKLGTEPTLNCLLCDSEQVTSSL